MKAAAPSNAIGRHRTLPNTADLFWAQTSILVHNRRLPKPCPGA